MSKGRNDTLTNFLPINRKFFDHPFWKEDRTFSKSEAWLDLIASARFEESEVTELIGGKMVSWTRGQLPASLRYLAERWKWSKNKVDDFLKLLEHEDMIERILIQGQTVLSLKNYETYNVRQQKGQQKVHQNQQQTLFPKESTGSKKDSERDIRGTPGGQAGDKTNIVNIENKEEEIFFGAEAPTYSLADMEMYKNLQDWISANTPKVGKMKRPITISEYLQLRKKLSREQLIEMLFKMENYKPLLQKNEWAYMTIINWTKKDFNNQAVNNGQSKENINDQKKAVEERTRQLASGRS
jgi:hypothetical protein